MMSEVECFSLLIHKMMSLKGKMIVAEDWGEYRIIFNGMGVVI